MFILVLLDGFLVGFSKFGVFIKKTIKLVFFYVMFESLAEPMQKWYHRWLSQHRTNFRVWSASV